MQTDTARGPTAAASFVLRGIAASLGLFGLLRLNWTEAHLVLPFTRLQGHVAAGLFGVPAIPIDVTLACSGADALALCVGAILAYPVKWRSRLAGAGLGAALILGLNTLRIGTLGRVATSPVWFNALHIYVWPLVLTLAIAGYVFAWMRVADLPSPSARQAPPSATARLGPPSRPAIAARAFPSRRVAVGHVPQPSWRFIVLTLAFVVMFLVAAPLYLKSSVVLALAGLVARAAAAILSVAGVSAYAAGGVLWAPRGGFQVTQECIATPLIPVYLAAVCAYSTTWRQRVLGALATLPLFMALGVLRLLVVALPDAVASPLFFVHAFYQLLLGVVVVFIAAVWRYGGRHAMPRALAGVLAGVLVAGVLGPSFTRAVSYPAGLPLNDPQGAIAFLPAFQIGLYLAVWVAAFVAVGWKRFLAGFAALEVTQVAGLVALHALTVHFNLTAHVRDIRGWAVAGPLVIVAAVVNVGRARR